MATLEELMMQDAAASADTAYTLSVGDGFEGQLEGRFDEDWVRVELVAGKSYDIRLEGVGPDGVGNTVLRVYNSAGEEVAWNDDVDLAALAFNLMVEFSPDTSGVYSISAGNYLQMLGPPIMAIGGWSTHRRMRDFSPGTRRPRLPAHTSPGRAMR